MPQLSTRLCYSFITTALLLTAGCTDGTPTHENDPESSSPSATMDGHDHSSHAHGSHKHAHPSEGPHHGELIELGNEEYHAELIHDEKAKAVTIYILDGSATKQVPINATEITINAKYDGKPAQFPLKSTPDESDPEGQSSRFVSDDETLTKLLNEDGAAPRLVLSISGKSYRGTITHHHDHAEHVH